MARDSRKTVEEEGVEWGPDTIEAEIRERVRGMIEAIVEEELEASGRQRYRNSAVTSALRLLRVESSLRGWDLLQTHVRWRNRL